MKKILYLLVLTTVFFIKTLYADVDASVDQTTIGINDRITLTIRADSPADFAPDLSALNNDFKILGMSSSSQTEVVNGQRTENKNWSIILVPTHTGKITIPSFDSKGVKTAPITINVVEDSQQNTAQGSDTNTGNNNTLFLKATLSPAETYPGYNAVYDLKIYYNAYIRNSPQLTLPTMEGIEFIPLDQSQNYTGSYEGKRYNILEQHYAIVGQKVGAYKIPPAILQGETYSGGTQASFYDADWVVFKKESNPITLTVKAIPEVAKNIWWLPAKSVSLEDSWSQTIPTFEQGQPVTRTLTLKALGVKAEQLPALQDSKINGFQLYPDKPELETMVSGNNVAATRVEKIAYIPSQTGNITLPAITVQWWNVTTNQLETITLPSKTIHVKGSGNPGERVENTHQSLQLATTKNNSVKIEGNTSSNTFHSSFFIFSTICLLVLWVITLFAWWYYAHFQRKKTPVHKPHLSHEHVENIRHLKREIEAACKYNNKLDVKANLLLLAAQLWHGETFLSISDVAEKFEEEDTIVLLKELEESLYGPANKSWQGAKLWLALKKEFHRKADKADKAEKEKSVLPELYLK